MSEQKAAAHIGGIYTIAAAIIGAVVGAVLTLVATLFVGVIRDSIAQSAQAAAHPRTDSGALIRQREPKQENAEPSAITMKAYYSLLANEGVPQLDVAKEYIGKRVRWEGYFYSLDTYLDSDAQRYRVLLICDPKEFHDYLYFYVAAADETSIAQIRKSSKVTVTGVLSGRTNLSDAKIESVE